MSDELLKVLGETAPELIVVVLVAKWLLERLDKAAATVIAAHAEKVAMLEAHVAECNERHRETSERLDRITDKVMRLTFEAGGSEEDEADQPGRHTRPT